jgi:hypothetical protein
MGGMPYPRAQGVARFRLALIVQGRQAGEASYVTGLPTVRQRPGDDCVMVTRQAGLQTL